MQEKNDVTIDFPTKWTRFENTAENRARLRQNGHYLIRWNIRRKTAGGQITTDCTIWAGTDSLGNGLSIEVARKRGRKIMIPFWAIKQVKRVD